MFLSNDTLFKTGFSPLLRFKVAALKLIANLPWLNDEDFRLTPMEQFQFKTKSALTETRGISKMSVFQKLIIFKSPNQRTVFELDSILCNLGIGFKFFRYCSTEVELNILSRATYQCYGPGRWILKEGHAPKNMYLIVKGSVIITKNVYNPILKTTNIVEQYELNAGKSFGESAVMFNTNRITSAKSLSTVELIVVSQEDFLDVTKDNLRFNWNENNMALNSLSHFNHLSQIELNKCTKVSFIKTFKQNEYVFGNGLGYLDYGYFVIEGQISLTYRLKVYENKKTSGNVEFTYCDKSEKSNNHDKKYTYKYVEVCKFLTGACFNIGENMSDKELMAITNDSKCLCVPQWFLMKTDELKNWTFLKLDLSNIIPDKNEAFRVFSAEQHLRT